MDHASGCLQAWDMPVADATLKRLGRRLRRLRLDRGLTQEQVAERAGFASGKYISEIEAGLRDLPVLSVKAVVEAGLGFTLRDAFEEVSPSRRKRTMTPEREPLPAHIEEAAYNIASLPAQKRRRVMALVRDALALAKE